MTYRFGFRWKKRAVILAWLSMLVFEVNAQIVLTTSHVKGLLPVQSWKARRDQNIVKQNFDYSCGAASLATLLNFYGKNISEVEVIKAMNKEDGMASFDDMARVLPQFGFKAQGIALSFEQLIQLKIPVIAYLKPERKDHFTVIRGISDNYVWLGDPSWGNRLLSRTRFLKIWETRPQSNLKGKVLVVLPTQSQKLVEHAFKTPSPHVLPTQMLVKRQL